MALPKPAGVKGLPYPVIRKVRCPDRVAAIVVASSGCKGISTWIGWRCSFLAWVKRTRPVNERVAGRIGLHPRDAPRYRKKIERQARLGANRVSRAILLDLVGSPRVVTIRSISDLADTPSRVLRRDLRFLLAGPGEQRLEGFQPLVRRARLIGALISQHANMARCQEGHRLVCFSQMASSARRRHDCVALSNRLNTGLT